MNSQSLSTISTLLLSLFLWLPSLVSAQELEGLNENSQYLQSNYEEGFDRIKAPLWAEWHWDEKVLVNEVNKQVDALLALLAEFDGKHTMIAFQAIATWSNDGWKDENLAFMKTEMKKFDLDNALEIRANWSMVLYEYKEEVGKKMEEEKHQLQTANVQQELVNIGNQVWMKADLDVSTFQNGDVIKQVTDEYEWNKVNKDGTPAWSYYENDPSNAERTGRLYNWSAVTDERGLCPAGWRIPQEEDWEALIDYLGGEDVAGVKLKSTENKMGQSTNESGFSAILGGFRQTNGKFTRKGWYGTWWTSSEWGGQPIFVIMAGNRDGVTVQEGTKKHGRNVRCFKQ